MKLFVFVILQFSILATVLCIPCDYKHPNEGCGYRCPFGPREFDEGEKRNPWQCPNDDLCIQKQDVCALPPYNIPRCPNGGDFGNVSCTAELCTKIGYSKCPFDDFCFSNYGDPCTDCPHGAKYPSECKETSIGFHFITILHGVNIRMRNLL